MDNKTEKSFLFVYCHKREQNTILPLYFTGQKSISIKLNPNINIDKSSTKLVFDTRHCCLPL
jgi:hypothetical protein